MNLDEVFLARSVVENGSRAKIHKFDIYEYESNDIIVIESTDENATNGLLYIPGLSTPFIPFRHKSELRHLLQMALKSPLIRTVFSQHFSLYNRQNGETFYGVDTALYGIAMGNDDWDSSYIMMNEDETLITGDVFVARTKAMKARLISDGDVQIKSNNEVTRDYILGVINTVFIYFQLLILLRLKLAFRLVLLYLQRK